jgi:hypothetical protein
MELRVVGAGVGRTGTKSLKLALEQLLGGPCYHMVDVFPNPEHVPHWHAAARGNPPDWRALLADYRAAVDWPASAFYVELADAFPDALVLLSLREPEAWFRSAEKTIFPTIDGAGDGPWAQMVRDLLAARFTPDFLDRDAAIAAFEAHNAKVRERIPAERLLEWRAGDGWEPICAALGLPVPELPFPHTNTSEEWAAARSDPASDAAT